MFWYGLAFMWICLQFLANFVENSSQFVSTRARSAIPADHLGDYPVDSIDGFGTSGTIVVDVERMTYDGVTDGNCMDMGESSDCVTLTARGVQNTQAAAHARNATVRADALSRWEAALQFSQGQSEGGFSAIAVFAQGALGMADWAVGTLSWDYPFLMGNDVGRLIRYIVLMPLSLVVILKFAQLIVSLASGGLRLVRGGV